MAKEKAKEVVAEAYQVKVEKAKEKEEVVAKEKAKEVVVKVERDDQWK